MGETWSRRRLAVFAISAGLVALVAVLPAGWGPANLGQEIPVVPGGDPSNFTTSVTCFSTSTPTPSSILLPIAPPNQSVPAGGSLGATVEFAIVNYSSHQSGVQISVPSDFATFPTSSGGEVQLYLPPQVFTATGSGWLVASEQTKTVVEPSGVTFATTGSAVLSTQKIAVLANATYGTMTLEVRWQWSITPSGGSTTHGPWSVPTSKANWPSSTPSEFYPAPYVAIASWNGPSETVGTNFSAQLTGIVASRYFFLELESPSTGKVSQDHGQTAASGATKTTVTIPMLNYDRYLYPGSYLVHIHDACGALLRSVSVTAAYASSASIHVTVQPVSCGKITFNGNSYGDGTSIATKPSSTPYAFSVPGCSGHAFKGWSFTGGLYVYSGSQLLVSSSGSMTVTYA